jgi:excinuclease ABC subunit C
VQLPPRDPVLYYLQRLRDEAHRFAISAHRAGRSKALTKSELDDIPGVGSAIKRRLLNHFGSARGVRQAGLADLEACPGIGPAVARRIHDHFHPGAAAPRSGGPPAARQAAAAPADAAATVAPGERTG